MKVSKKYLEKRVQELIQECDRVGLEKMRLEDELRESRQETGNTLRKNIAMTRLLRLYLEENLP